MNVSIFSPDNNQLFTDVVRTSLPTTNGSVQILPGHAESFLLLVQGDILIQFTHEQQKKISIEDGELYVSGNNIVIIQ